MTLVDSVRGEIEASLRMAAMTRDAQRDPGLSMSSLGVCTSRALRILAGEKPSSYPDPWNGMRGTYLHAGIERDRREHGTPDMQEAAVTFDFDGLTVHGHLDELLIVDGKRVCVDYKSRDKPECRYHAKHGPDRDSAMATTGYALAVNADAAMLVYVPLQGRLDEWVYCPLDLDYWSSEVRAWLWSVRKFDGPIGEAPRDKPASWCKACCPFMDSCRGDHDFGIYGEITDPTFAEAVRVAFEAQQEGREKDRKTAMSILKHVEGRVGDVLLTWSDVAATPTRAGFRRPNLRRVA